MEARVQPSHCTPESAAGDGNGSTTASPAAALTEPGTGNVGEETGYSLIDSL